MVLALLGLLQMLDQLGEHVSVALRHGLSTSEVSEVMVQLSIYAGLPRAIAASRRVRETLDQISSTTE